MTLIFLVLVVSVLTAAGVAVWRFVTERPGIDWARVRRGLSAAWLLTLTVIATEAAIRSPLGVPEAFMWTARVLLAAGMTYLWARWARAERRPS